MNTVKLQQYWFENFLKPIETSGLPAFLKKLKK